jgi:adenine-specific DNA methylase
MDSYDDIIEDDFSFYLDNYKDQFVAQGLDDSTQNNSLLEDAKDKVNSVLSNLGIEKSRLVGENKKMRKRIDKMNSTIEKAKTRNNRLEDESGRLANSDLGAIEQNQNTTGVYRNYQLKIFLKVCLLATILMFLYINDDIVQAIRSRFSKNTK